MHQAGNDDSPCRMAKISLLIPLVPSELGNHGEFKDITHQPKADTVPFGACAETITFLSYHFNLP
jgi:hypothetical protein